MFQAISQRDLIVVKSVVMILVFAVILVNFIVDLSYAGGRSAAARRAERRASQLGAGRLAARSSLHRRR